MDESSIDQRINALRDRLTRLNHSLQAAPTPLSPPSDLLPGALETIAESLETLELAQGALRAKEQALQACQSTANARQQQAQASEMKLNMVLENAIAAIKRFQVYEDGDWYYDYLSPGCEKIFGYTAEELTSDKKLWLSRIPVEDVQNIILPGYQDIFAERTLTIKYRFRCPGEELIWVSEILTATRNDETNSWVCTSVAMDITALKRVEAALQDSESRYRNLVSHIPGAVYRCPYASNDLAMIMSDEIETIVGYPASDFVQGGNRRYASIIHPDDFTGYTQLIREALNRRQPFTLEYRAIHADGSVKWLYERGQGVFDSQDNLLYLDGIIFDITDRKQLELERRQVEATLQLNQERYQLASQVGKVGVWEWNLVTNELFTDPSLPALLGYAEHELNNYSDQWLQFVHADDRPVVTAQMDAFLQGITTNYEVEHRKRHRDGSIRWFLARGNLIRDEHGQPIRFLGTTTDVTERKQASLALQDSEERFRQLAENIDAIFWVYSADFAECIYVSPAFQRLTGCRCPNLYANPASYIDVVYPDDRLLVKASIARIRRGESYDIEHRYLRADGTIGWLKNRGFPVRKANSDEIYRCAGIATDISNRKQADAQIRSSLREKEVLLSEVHHRVKNNLQLISSMLELQAMGAADPQIEQVLQNSQTRVKAIANVHESLYQSQNFAEINIASYMRMLAIDLLNTYTIPNQQIGLDLQVDQPILLSLEKAIPCGLILNELMANALKYGFKQQQTGQIRIALTTNTASQVSFAVTNSGDALPADFQLGHHQSLGLRLVIALVQQLEGTLEVERGDFTTFKVTFKI